MKHPYGNIYARRISRATAKALLNPKGYDLPKMGYQIEIARTDNAIPLVLHIDNISGEYWLSSHNAKRSNWRLLFKISGD